MSDIRERKVEWHPKTLKQISQIPKDGLEFAYVSEDYRQVHQLVWCKDFMQDAAYGFLNNKAIEIYGFEYNPVKNPPLYTDQTRLLVCNWRDKEFQGKLLKNCLPFLNGIETQLKMKKTVVERCVNPPPIYRRSGVFIIEGSKRWMASPPMISLYTLLIRIGLVHVPTQSFSDTLSQIQAGALKPYNWQPDQPSKYADSGFIHEDNDSDFLNRGRAGLDRILKYGDRRLFHNKIEDNYAITDSDDEVSVETLHESCGLGGFSSGHTKNYFPYWHRLES